PACAGLVRRGMLAAQVTCKLGFAPRFRGTDFLTCQLRLFFFLWLFRPFLHVPTSLKGMKHNSPVSRSGRFAKGPSEDVARFTESVSFDWRLWRQDIAGSKAHATMLQKIGLLSRGELAAILKGLDAIGDEIAKGKFRWRPQLEDVHMNVE